MVLRVEKVGSIEKGILHQQPDEVTHGKSGFRHAETLEELITG